MLSPQPRPPAAVFWTLWAAILAGAFAYQFKLGGGIPQGANIDGSITPLPIIITAGVELVVATGIRWILVPRTSDRTPLLVLLFIGLALSNNIGFFGIFLVPPSYPQTKLVFFLASILGMLQFAPFFAPPIPAGNSTRE